MLDNKTLFISILIISAVTFSTRLFPFALFGRKGKVPPAIITYLGKYLPPAIICGILVYCFKDVNYSSLHSILPEVIAVSTVVILHKIKGSTVLSIFSGTAVYMILIQTVFS